MSQRVTGNHHSPESPHRREPLLNPVIAESQPEVASAIARFGGLDAVMASAYGIDPESGIQDILPNRPFTRRKFLQQVAIAAALTVTTNCANPDPKEADLSPMSRLEKTHLKIGFIPITCATPIIMSQPLGFYQKYGLNVELVKMENWEQVRDSAIAGELDAYHLLSPMPIAMTLGLGSQPFPIKLASIENINGQALVLALKHQDKVKESKDFKGLTLGIPFPYSMHNLLLRYYLASNDINPDRDINIKQVPPSQAIKLMKAGELDGFLMPDGNAQQAVYEKVGFIYLLTKDLWDGHPCCSFAASKPWIDKHPSTFRALNKAIIDGCNYARNPGNRREIAQVIAAPEYLNQPQSVLEAVLTGTFDDGLGNIRTVSDRIDFDPYPWKSFSYWITAQFARWGMVEEQNISHEAIADEVFLTGLARQLAKQLGQTPPTIILRYEQLKFGLFDPSEPDAYLQGQIQKHGF
ncbi:CmpA/NrtA family ABC transporter substrate-binding protein [Laspinema palackyanum]|uniref:CmpA/NrtA family ABC transporter substrate-binding protein n=1 Tax=Laspinema palackyanum TaxID=3231601 RepID=UPI00345D695F|nr:ABC transporter substrate-binding protein [Laspinema sp. D2c]